MSFLFSNVIVNNSTTLKCGSIELQLPELGPSEDINNSLPTGDNVIQIAMSSIGVSYTQNVGTLDGLDLTNVDAVSAIYGGLLEELHLGTIYDLYLDPNGSIVVYTVGQSSAIVETFGARSYELTEDTAVVVTGRSYIPYIRVDDPISIVSNGTGDGVAVYSYGAFNYGGCGNRLYNYYGSVSYKDPHFEVTSDSDIDHLLSLKSYESVTGLIYMLSKPDDMDLSLSDTTLVPVDASLYIDEEIQKPYNLAYEVEVEPEKVFSGCDHCINVDITGGTLVYSSSDVILGIDSALLYGAKLLSGSSVTSSDSSVCGETSGSSGSNTSEGTTCSNVLTSASLYSLSVGSDVMYNISGDGGKYEIRVAIPVFTTNWDEFFGASHITREWCTLPASLSTVRLPAEVSLLISVDRPSINFTKKTDYSVGISGNVTPDYDAIASDAASQVSFCVAPIIQVSKPAATAYVVGGSVTAVDQEDCIVDSDPRTKQDFDDTPCAKMDRDLSGHAVFNITINSIIDSGDVAKAAGVIYDIVNAKYTTGSANVDPFIIDASDLGKELNGGIINRISWSYQDGSAYRANITYGPKLVSSQTTNATVKTLAVDQTISRQAVVLADEGDGLSFKVHIRNLGYYDAISVVPVEIKVGDIVNVSIYNNVAESV